MFSRNTYGPRTSSLLVFCLLSSTLVLTGVVCPISPFPGLRPPGNSGLTGKYVGSERCKQCHTRTHQDWAETLHSTALETLEAIGQGTNANCIVCHTVGFGKTGGFVSRALTNDLAGVGCEACHGPARDHVENVADESLRPPKIFAASVCGQCHTGSHHPNFDEWAESGHSMVTEVPSNLFEMGILLNNCGRCHSGEFYYRSILNMETVPDDALQGQAREDQIAVTCVVCHDPHHRTGNALSPDEGRDYQLRYPEAASPVPANTIDAATDATRFNLCGQCHHSRGGTWVATNSGPHHSVQSNVYVGEMPMPGADPPLVPNRLSVHSFAPRQCATCHLHRQDFLDEQAPAIAGHTFTINNAGCSSVGCHPSTEAGYAAQVALQTEIRGRLDSVLMLLGDPATWEYSSGGGPMDQSMITDEVKKARFLYKYVLADGSLGIHNPDYVRSMLEEAEDLLAP